MLGAAALAAVLSGAAGPGGAPLAPGPAVPPHDPGPRGDPARPYMDGPPPGHTGGFGEPACQRCHFDAPVDPPDARLEVRGFPETYAPDSTYRLTVMLTAPDLGRGGFQLAVRCREGRASGRQAGRLSADDARAEVVRGRGEELRGDSTVLYARHTGEGSRTTAADTATWRLAWTAPGRRPGPSDRDGQGAAPASAGPAGGCSSAVLHAAANAANGDDSEFGDRVLTRSWRTRAGGTRR